MKTEQYIELTNLEEYISKYVKPFFEKNHYIETFDFFCIIIWKANRAKSKIYKRLSKQGKLNINDEIKALTFKIYNTKEPKEKLKILLKEYRLRLPMATAILTMLYPDDFTIYDIRVCNMFNKFYKINNLENFEKTWIGYSEYLKEVGNYNSELSLRDNDKLLWGKSFYNDLVNDINKKFIKDE